MASTTVDVAATFAGLDVLTLRINDATAAITADVLHLLQIAGAANAPVGTPGNSTNPAGDLARSIDVEGPRGGDGLYEGEVGPTVVYGRQRELGGTIYGKPTLYFWTDVAYQTMEGGFSPGGVQVFTHKVHQFGAHYMLRAWDDVVPVDVEPLARGRIAAAIAGS